MSDRSGLCPRPELNALVGEYVSGRLAEDRIEAFELHLLDCAECAEEARLGAAVRRARRVPSRRWPIVVLPPLASAAVIAFFFASSRNPYVDLGRVTDAPGFTPAAIRADSGGAAAMTDSGMAAYARSDYRTAERLLAQGNADQAGTAFFLGVCRLILQRPRQAVEPLRRAQTPPGNAFEAESRYYLAKAFLQLGWPDSALAQLRAAERFATVSEQAVALRRSVEQVQRVR